MFFFHMDEIGSSWILFVSVDFLDVWLKVVIFWSGSFLFCIVCCYQPLPNFDEWLNKILLKVCGNLWDLQLNIFVTQKHFLTLKKPFYFKEQILIKIKIFLQIKFIFKCRLHKLWANLIVSFQFSNEDPVTRRNVQF